MPVASSATVRSRTKSTSASTRRGRSNGKPSGTKLAPIGSVVRPHRFSFIPIAVSPRRLTALLPHELETPLGVRICSM